MIETDEVLKGCCKWDERVYEGKEAEEDANFDVESEFA